MKTALRMALVSALLLALGAGCSAATEAEPEVTGDDSAELGAALDAALPPPADPAQRLYFGGPMPIVTITADAHLSSWTFRAHGDHEFKASVMATNDGGASMDTSKAVGFKLYRLGVVRGRPAWRLVTTADGPTGSAVTTLTAPATRTYLLTAAAGQWPTTVQIGLSCRGETSLCTVGQQPGAACSNKLACDQGLFCEREAGQCGAAVKGTCAVAPQVCPEIYAPVCGCDSKTYSNACFAKGASATVAHAGACGCEKQWSPLSFEIDGSVLAANRWADGTDKTALHTYDLAEDGSASSYEVPACTHASPPCLPKIAVRQGRWTLDGRELRIAYADRTQATFAIQGNCLEQVRFVGRDFGQRLTLTALAR